VQVSKISTAAAQIGALKARRGKSRAWINSVGASAVGWGGSLSERIAAVSSGVATGASIAAHPIGSIGSSDTYFDEITRAGASPDCVITVTAATGAIAFATGTVPTAAALEKLLGAKLVLTVLPTAAPTPAGVYVAHIASTAAGTALVAFPPPAADVASQAWYCVSRAAENTNQAKNSIEVMWQPPLAIMDTDTPPLGGGSFRFELTPYADFQTRMAEALFNLSQTLIGFEWAIEMKAPDLYLYTSRDSYGDSRLEFPLREYQSYSQRMTESSKILQLTVPRSTAKIHLFLQSDQAGKDITASSSSFTSAGRTDLKLKSVQVTYAGQTKFRTPWQSSYGDGVNQLTAAYFASLVESERDLDETPCITTKGASPSTAATSGGAETVVDWFRRGPIWTLAFNRGAGASEVDVTVDINYEVPPNATLFVVAEYDRLCSITSQANQIVAVEVVNA
jgi:hypothetical protein